jgi:putative transcriptional regulator
MPARGHNAHVESLRGQLLVASPVLLDPNFRRTVVLITEHGPAGAMGLVLNRPSQTTVGEALDELTDLLDEEEPVFVGGPVEEGAVMVLAELDDPDEAAAIVLGDDVGFLPAGFDPVTVGAVTRRARVFAGYAGWGERQLEGELEEGSWILEPARSDDVFSDRPHALWSEVLRRKGGRYAMLALMPADPSVN